MILHWISEFHGFPMDFPWVFHGNLGPTSPAPGVEPPPVPPVAASHCQVGMGTEKMGATARAKGEVDGKQVENIVF